MNRPTAGAILAWGTLLAVRLAMGAESEPEPVVAPPPEPAVRKVVVVEHPPAPEPAPDPVECFVGRPGRRQPGLGVRCQPTVGIRRTP